VASQRESRSTRALQLFHNHVQDWEARPSPAPQKPVEVKLPNHQPTEAWAALTAQAVELPATLSEQGRFKASETLVHKQAPPRLYLRAQVALVLPTQIYRRDLPI